MLTPEVAMGVAVLSLAFTVAVDPITFQSEAIIVSPNAFTIELYVLISDEFAL
jgi:hypothetical protein